MAAHNDISLETFCRAFIADVARKYGQRCEVHLIGPAHRPAAPAPVCTICKGKRWTTTARGHEPCSCTDLGRFWADLKS